MQNLFENIKNESICKYFKVKKNVEKIWKREFLKKKRKRKEN